jgi:8-oxo-dGTP pyrophosphatase MutT (NUDIX family)
MSDLKKYTDYKTILSVNALIWCDGKVLLQKRADDKKVDPGVFSGIGGKVEPHESFYNKSIFHHSAPLSTYGLRMGKRLF